MSWFFLILAGLMEVVGVIAMKKFVSTKKKIFLLYPIPWLFISGYARNFNGNGLCDMDRHRSCWWSYGRDFLF